MVVDRDIMDKVKTNAFLEKHFNEENFIKLIRELSNLWSENSKIWYSNDVYHMVKDYEYLDISNF